MTFGGCYIRSDSSIENMTAKSVKIEGRQQGLLTNFEITQTFIHSKDESKQISYIFPNDLKICIYDLKFIVGEKIIKPVIKAKEEAKKIYNEAVEQGKTAVYSTNVKNGLSEIKIGNLPPEIECKVILKVALLCQITNTNTFFIKFPLDVYTPSGSKRCLDVKASEFNFELQCDSEKIIKVTSNVINSKFDSNTKLFTITDKIENQVDENSIIITFQTQDRLKSTAIIDTKSNGENLLLTISPIVPPTNTRNNEFVFLVDCSGSMCGTSIKKASECLNVFIRSLPMKSYFNIIRFGTSYVKLFANSVEYNEETMEKSLKLISNLDADFGGTELYPPLKDIFKNKSKFGQRQIFIITDGEVSDVGELLELISEHSNDNRCFTIGIGRGCDAGLVEGMAKASSGKCDFVQEGDSISEKVIPQLESSLLPFVDYFEVHIGGEGNDSFEVSPYPIPSIPANGCGSVFVHLKNKNKNEIESNGILVTASFDNKTIEIPIDEIIEAESVDEDNFGCSKGKNIRKAIFPLYVFNLIQNTKYIDKARIIDLSIQSGVLCQFTGYVGVLEPTFPYEEEEEVEMAGGFDDLFGFGCSYTRARCNYARVDSDDDFNRREEEEVEMAGGFDDLFGDGYCGCSNTRARCNYERVDGDDDFNRREEEEVEMAGGFDDLFDVGGGSSYTHIKSSDENEQKKEEEVELAGNRDDVLSHQYNLMDLIKLQKFDGHWDDLVKINGMLNLDVKKIDGIEVPDKNLESKCISTILAIAAFHVKSQDEMNTWKMIEQKAIAWLKSNLSNIDIDKIIEQAKKLINE